MNEQQPHPPRKKCNCELCWHEKQFDALNAAIRTLTLNKKEH